MPCANIFHGIAAPILGSRTSWVGIDEARDPMNRCNFQLPSHVDPATIVIKIIHEKPNFRLFVGLKFINDYLQCLTFVDY